MPYEILLQHVSIVPCLCVFGISHFGLYYLYSSTKTVIDTLGKLSEYDIYVEDINGELEECYEMMYKEPVQESDIRGLVLDTVSMFYHNIRDGR